MKQKRNKVIYYAFIGGMEKSDLGSFFNISLDSVNDAILSFCHVSGLKPPIKEKPSAKRKLRDDQKVKILNELVERFSDDGQIIHNAKIERVPIYFSAKFFGIDERTARKRAYLYAIKNDLKPVCRFSEIDEMMNDEIFRS